MSNIKRYDIDPIDVDADGIAESQTPAAGGAQNLTLDGVLCDVGTAAQFNIEDSYSTGIRGVRIGIASAGDDSLRTFTVRGKNQDGTSLSEDITGANAGTAESVAYFSEITQISVDDDTAGAVTVGPVDEIITATYPLNTYTSVAATIAVTGLAGTCQFDIDETFSDIWNNPSTDAVWLTIQSNKSADLVDSATLGATGIRLKFDSYSSGAELQFAISQFVGVC